MDRDHGGVIGTAYGCGGEGAFLEKAEAIRRRIIGACKLWMGLVVQLRFCDCVLFSMLSFFLVPSLLEDLEDASMTLKPDVNVVAVYVRIMIVDPAPVAGAFNI